MLKATACGQGAVFAHSVPQKSMDEADLLGGELSLTGDDAGFRAALARGSRPRKTVSPMTVLEPPDFPAAFQGSKAPRSRTEP